MSKGKRGSIENEGITWMFRKREQLGTISITAENRRDYYKSYYNDYIEGSKELVENGLMSKEQVEKDADKFALAYINYAKKAEKAHLKGKMYFTFQGRKEVVPTFDRVSRLQKYLADLEENYISQNKTEEE